MYLLRTQIYARQILPTERLLKECPELVGGYVEAYNINEGGQSNLVLMEDCSREDLLMDKNDSCIVWFNNKECVVYRNELSDDLFTYNTKEEKYIKLKDGIKQPSSAFKVDTDEEHYNKFTRLSHYVRNLGSIFQNEGISIEDEEILEFIRGVEDARKMLTRLKIESLRRIHK